MDSRKFGLLGRTLGHSWSPQIHSMLADYEYRLYEVEPGDLDRFLRTTDLDGMNVTIPYKKDVLPYCTRLSDAARRIGSAAGSNIEKNGGSRSASANSAAASADACAEETRPLATGRFRLRGCSLSCGASKQSLSA